MSYLDISENPLGDEAIQIICDGIVANKSKLKILHLRRTNMTGEIGFKAVAKVLESANVGLTSLDVSENDVNGLGVAAIGNALMGSLATLTTLNMHGLNCGSEGFNAVSEAISKPNSKIRWLDVSNCKLGDVGASMLLNSHNKTRSFEIVLQ
ncbi:hypothetical protein HDU99_007882, partial [Rhizoclosmatium hyalinum]